MAKSPLNYPRYKPNPLRPAGTGAFFDFATAVGRRDEERKRRLEAEGLAFLAGFAELRGKLVRPMFEAVGALLKSRGHDFAIREDEFVFEGDGKTIEAAIGLRITPAGMETAAASDVHLRELLVSTRHYNKTASVMKRAGAQSGSIAGAAGHSHPTPRATAR